MPNLGDDTSVAGAAAAAAEADSGLSEAEASSTAAQQLLHGAILSDVVSLHARYAASQAYALTCLLNQCTWHCTCKILLLLLLHQPRTGRLWQDQRVVLAQMLCLLPCLGTCMLLPCTGVAVMFAACSLVRHLWQACKLPTAGMVVSSTPSGCTAGCSQLLHQRLARLNRMMMRPGEQPSSCPMTWGARSCRAGGSYLLSALIVPRTTVT